MRSKGKNRALIAVAHSLPVTVYSFPVAGQPYCDLGKDYFEQQNKDRLEKSPVRRLEKLGHKVILEPSTAA